MSTDHVFLFMKDICETKSAVCSNDHMSLVYTTSYPEIIPLLPWALFKRVFPFGFNLYSVFLVMNILFDIQHFISVFHFHVE